MKIPLHIFANLVHSHHFVFCYQIPKLVAALNTGVESQLQLDPAEPILGCFQCHHVAQHVSGNKKAHD